jgi:uncharacterized protein with HEPN domain
MFDRRRKLLHDAVSAAGSAESFVAGQSLAAYEADRMRQLAVERLLEILGEACSRLAKEDPDFLVEIPSARLAIGLRNRVIHGYDSVDSETVYRTVTEDLPGLHAALKAMLARLA